jgi:hypothetical protein
MCIYIGQPTDDAYTGSKVGGRIEPSSFYPHKPGPDPNLPGMYVYIHIYIYIYINT